MKVSNWVRYSIEKWHDITEIKILPYQKKNEFRCTLRMFQGDKHINLDMSINKARLLRKKLDKVIEVHDTVKKKKSPV